MDEREFTEYLKKSFNFSYGIGIGDDCSVVKQPDHYQVITKDLFVEGTHFDLSYFSLIEIAKKAVNVNISDILAMGGTPQYFFLGLCLPGNFPEQHINTFFKGIREVCDHYKIELAGGDYSVSDQCMISITMIGRAEKVIYRNGAQTGDLIGISGVPGQSALGLKLLKKGIMDSPYCQKHKEIILDPAAGKILAGYVNSMIDVSDGLLIDLNRILCASGRGAEIFFEKIPLSESFQKTCRQYNYDLYDLVLAGGEDYILLFTLSQELEQELRNEKLKFSIIGKVIESTGRIKVSDGDKEIFVTRYGYDHFKNGALKSE